MDSATHIVLNAPKDPDRLRESAKARLSDTLLRLRRKRLSTLFAAHGLNVDAVLEINETTVRHRDDVELSADRVADLTRAVRALAKRRPRGPHGWRDDVPTELARKAEEYLVADTQLRRIARWIDGYVRRHAGPPAWSRLDREAQQLLRRGSGPLPLAGPSTDHALDEWVARVHARAPWLSHATTAIWHHARATRAAGLHGLALPPILLHGPAGTGKSSLARIVAEEAGLPVAEIDVGAGTSAFRIAGVEAGWGSRQIGDALRLVCEDQTANPIFVVNELDKVGAGIVSTSGTRSSMSDALLPLLEPTTARRFRCPASGLDCDLSRVLWIMTANEANQIDPVLRSRLEPIELPALGREDLEQYVDLVIPEEDRGAVRRLLGDLPVGPRLTLRHVRRLADRLRGAERQDMLH